MKYIGIMALLFLLVSSAVLAMDDEVVEHMPIKHSHWYVKDGDILKKLAAEELTPWHIHEEERVKKANLIEKQIAMEAVGLLELPMKESDIAATYFKLVGMYGVIVTAHTKNGGKIIAKASRTGIKPWGEESEKFEIGPLAYLPGESE